jgi:hypothetical protein
MTFLYEKQYSRPIKPMITLKKQSWRLCMKNTSALDDMAFNMEGGKYSELADSLEYWAEKFYLDEETSDAYSDQISYLLYNMANQMRELTDD